MARSLCASGRQCEPGSGPHMKAPELRTGAQILCEALVREGVDVIFGIPGGAIMPFYHALPEYPQLRHVLCRHEQGAGHAAEGYARASGRVGVCVATSGPGATNLVTPIADAWMDSTPLVAITGQVASHLLGKDAFQETDITGITVPITKHNYLVTRAEDLPYVFREAFHLAATGRPGPVLIDVTKDAQQARVTPNWDVTLRLPGYRPTYRGNRWQIRKAIELLTHAERPLIMAGNGGVPSPPRGQPPLPPPRTSTGRRTCAAPRRRSSCRTTSTRRSTARSTGAAATASSPTSASTRCGPR